MSEKLIRWLTVMAMPVFLGFGMILFVIYWDAPSYPEFEYGRIAPDPYGFTLEERLELADATIHYLRRTEPSAETIYLLEELMLPDGSGSLYNEREIEHMVDVKDLTDAIRRIWYGSVVLLIGGLGYLLAGEQRRPAGRRAVYHGGLATVIVLLVIAGLILFGWSFFFVQFHELLFPPGTWTFRYSDSLIRLFPEQFWFDVGVIISVGTLLLGLVVTAVGNRLTKQQRT